MDVRVLTDGARAAVVAMAVTLFAPAVTAPPGIAGGRQGSGWETRVVSSTLLTQSAVPSGRVWAETTGDVGVAPRSESAQPPQAAPSAVSSGPAQGPSLAPSPEPVGEATIAQSHIPATEARSAGDAARALSVSAGGPAATIDMSMPLTLLGVLSGLLALSLLQSLHWSTRRIALAPSRRTKVQVVRSVEEPAAAHCRTLVETAGGLWRTAETAVMALDPHLPLRTLLMNELSHISRRLAASPALKAMEGGALASSEPEAYWRMLTRDLNRSVADLKRIAAVAEASRASFGHVDAGEPRMPTTRQEAYFILGANSSVDADTLRRLVRALRQCWHPDLAKDDADRRYREARIRQINVASDIVLSGNG